MSFLSITFFITHLNNHCSSLVVFQEAAFWCLRSSINWNPHLIILCQASKWKIIWSLLTHNYLQQSCRGILFQAQAQSQSFLCTYRLIYSEAISTYRLYIYIKQVRKVIKASVIVAKDFNGMITESSLKIYYYTRIAENLLGHYINVQRTETSKILIFSLKNSTKYNKSTSYYYKVLVSYISSLSLHYS